MSLLNLIGLYVICCGIVWMYLKFWADVVAPNWREWRNRERDRR